MKGTDIHRVYFLGIGGIGMSALARYFLASGKVVAGYDRVATPFTEQLISEGMQIHFEDSISLIPDEFRDHRSTMVVYTPAIPGSHSELRYFKTHGYNLLKRAAVLGNIMKDHKGIAVAGTHGKTTISTMIAHIFTQSGIGCNAFLGGISKNFKSNLVLEKKSDYFIAEADEFDRSFLTLFPDYAVVTSMDDDHMDIYGDRKNLIASFNQFVSQIKPSGILILKNSVSLQVPSGIKTFRYALDETSDYYAFNISREDFIYTFSMHTPSGNISEIRLGANGKLNIENAVAACAIAHLAGIGIESIKISLENYLGVIRRFDVKIHNRKIVFIDDYAHHPEEIKAFITSVKEIFPGKRITGVFQPHLYSRTKTFYSGFADSLSILDDVILLDIYPAREEPLPGISSALILKVLKNKGERLYCSTDTLLPMVEKLKPEVFLTMGAGDIDQLVEPLKEMLLHI